MRPKDTVFLHIGMHKTATTSIQHSLKTYTDGVTRYARLGRPNHSRLLASAFSAAATTRRHLARAGADSSPQALHAHRAASLALLETQINTPERNLILSGEGLAGLALADVADLQTFLSARCTRIHLIAYIRDPIGFASSAYQQRIQSGQKTDFNVPVPDYRRRFGAYLDVFGADAMDFVRFAPQEFPDHCIITDFCNRTGIDASQVNKKRSNESLSNEVVALLLFWNRDGVQSFGSLAHLAARKKIVTLLRQGFPGKFKFDPDLVRAELGTEDSHWMEQQAGFSLQATPSDGAGVVVQGISSEQNLKEICIAAMPGLRQILAGQNLPAGGQVSTRLMDRLYTALLKATQAEASGQGD